jgi:hypothetical protein
MSHVIKLVGVALLLLTAGHAQAAKTACLAGLAYDNGSTNGAVGCVVVADLTYYSGNVILQTNHNQVSAPVGADSGGAFTWTDANVPNGADKVKITVRSVEGTDPATGLHYTYYAGGDGTINTLDNYGITYADNKPVLVSAGN